jgi:hypothetical protein
MKFLILDLVCLKIGNKKNKIKTKTTSAKKVLRKNIKVNSKVIFDEDGEVGIIN